MRRFALEATECDGSDRSSKQTVGGSSPPGGATYAQLKLHISSTYITALGRGSRRDERSEVRAPEPTEVMQLLRVAAEGCVDVHVAVFVRLLAAIGMRRGEACAALVGC